MAGDSTLVTYGYSFGDEHINRVIREANLMAGGEQFRNEGRADETRGPGDEDLHACILFVERDKSWQICYPVKVVTLSWYNCSQDRQFFMAATTLASFLRDRRTRLDPATFGLSGRRRTPGLRREEIAQRANISPTWYTWLEQGRGGAPSADVLNRIARAMLDGAPRVLTDGATHFHTRGVKPSWSKRFAKTAAIGAHLFYRQPGTRGQGAA